MAEPKTKPTDESVDAFLAAVEPASRRTDCLKIREIMERVTGSPARLWGPSIVGFGAYTYVNTTGKPADWPITGFSPRKANLTVYIIPGFSRYDELLARLGRHTTGKSCLYLKSLDGIDLAVLEEMITDSVAYMRKNYPTT